jgi:hypothetical protein
MAVNSFCQAAVSAGVSGKADGQRGEVGMIGCLAVNAICCGAKIANDTRLRSRHRTIFGSYRVDSGHCRIFVRPGNDVNDPEQTF